MSKVVQFPGAAALPASEDVRHEGHIEQPPAQPQEQKAPVYVRVHAGLFQEMLNALAFYAGQGWDQGGKARVILNEVYKPELPVA